MRKSMLVFPRAAVCAALAAVLTAGAAGAAVAATAAPAATADKVIAKSGRATVTQAELETFLRALDAPSRGRLAADKAMLERLVQSRLAQKAVLMEAEAKGWGKRPEVAAQVRDAEQAIVVRSYLDSLTQPPQGYPSEAELKTAYEANPAAFAAPKAYHLAQIYLAASGDDAAVGSARKDAESLAAQARAAGVDFGALAKARSQEPRSAAGGGDNGWVAEAEMIPEIRSVVTAMKVGAVSDPVRSSSGFHVLKLLEVREAGKRGFDEVRERLRATMRQQYQADAAQNYLKQQVPAQGASVDKAALDSVISAVR
ncbi:peptidylprolyl isomerase [Cupriavidus sp. WS]|uniref:peptidylprolyl isomerase n=1 Tax=Cupriavidus sp. WS TaxID=1312922 RepID=UPI000382C68C|nr:peptidylprolyl isomerase [Cupriavidus sp. WS]